MVTIIERLNSLKKQQDELLVKLFDYYASYSFEYENLIEHEEDEDSFFFKLSEGPLKDHLIEIDSDEYNFIFGKKVSDLKELHIFIITPERASKIN